MPVFGNDLICQGYKVIDAVLTDAKLDELVGPPEPGKIYRLADGTPYYVTATGVPTPLHENSITVVDVPDGSPLTATTNGRVVQLDITPADATNPGTLSPAYYDLLSNASNGNIPGTLVVRGNDSPTSFEIVSATAITIDAPPDVNFSSYSDTFVVPKGYIDDAIVTAVDALDTGVSAVTGLGAITATPPDEDGVVEVSIATATSTNPGTQSPEHFALLDAATTELGSFAGKLVVAQDWGGGTFLTSLHSVQADSVTARVMSVSTPISDDEVTNKIYVDDAIATAAQDLAASIGGRDFKNSVALCYKSNISLTAVPPVQGGVAVDVGKSVLLIGQTNPAENGCYKRSGSTLIRREDSTAEFLSAGATYIVESGDYAGDRYQLATADFVLDQDPLLFLDSTDATTAGTNLVQDGRIISLAPAYDGSVNTRISAAVNPIAARVTTIENTGYQTAAQVLSSITTAVAENNASNKYVAVIGDGVATSFVLAHNLGEDIDVTIWENKFPSDKVYTDISRQTANSIRVSFGSPPAPQAYKVVVK